MASLSIRNNTIAVAHKDQRFDFVGSSFFIAFAGKLGINKIEKEVILDMELSLLANKVRGNVGSFSRKLQIFLLELLFPILPLPFFFILIIFLLLFNTLRIVYLLQIVNSIINFPFLELLQQIHVRFLNRRVSERIEVSLVVGEVKQGHFVLVLQVEFVDEAFEFLVVADLFVCYLDWSAISLTILSFELLERYLRIF